MLNPLFKLTALLSVMSAGALVVVQAQKHLAKTDGQQGIEAFTPLVKSAQRSPVGPAASAAPTPAASPTASSHHPPAQSEPSGAAPSSPVRVETAGGDPFAFLYAVSEKSPPAGEATPPAAPEDDPFAAVSGRRTASAAAESSDAPAQFPEPLDLTESADSNGSGIALASAEMLVEQAPEPTPLKKFPDALQAPVLLAPPSADRSATDEPLPEPAPDFRQLVQGQAEPTPAVEEAAAPTLLAQAAAAPPARDRSRPTPPPPGALDDPFTPSESPPALLPQPVPAPLDADDSPFLPTLTPGAAPSPSPLNLGPNPFPEETAAAPPPARERSRPAVPNTAPPATEEPLFLPDSPPANGSTPAATPPSEAAAFPDLFIPGGTSRGPSPPSVAAEFDLLPPGAGDAPPPGPSNSDPFEPTADVAPPARTREPPARQSAPTSDSSPFPTDFLPNPGPNSYDPSRTPPAGGPGDPFTAPPQANPEPTFTPEFSVGPGPGTTSTPPGTSSIPPGRSSIPTSTPEPVRQSDPMPLPSFAPNPNQSSIPLNAPTSTPAPEFAPVPAPTPLPHHGFVPDAPAQAPPRSSIPAFPSANELHPPGSNPPGLNSPGPVAAPATSIPPRDPNLTGGGTLDAAAPAGRQQPELQIEKDAPPRAVLNQPLVYNIRVRNVGRTAAHQVIVEDSVPRGSTLVGTNPGATQDPQDKHLSWELGTLAPGDERLIRVQIIPVEPGEIGSVATVRFVGRIAARTVITAPKLSIEMTGPVETAVGDTPVFKYRITNVGDGDAANVTVQCTIPNVFQHPSGAELENDLGMLKAGQSRELDLTVASARSGRGVNTAAVLVDGQEHDRVSADVVVLGSRLSLERTGPERRFVNRPANYTTQVANQSSQVLRNITVVEQLPAGVELAAVPEHGRYDAARRMIVWMIPQLGPQEARQFHSSLVTAEPGSYASNVKVWDAAGNRAEATSQLQIAGFSSLKVDVAQTTQRGGEVAVGEQVALRMTVANRGSAAASDIVTEFEIPAELEFVAARPDRYMLDADGRKVRFEAIPALDVNGEHVIDIVCVAKVPGIPRVAASIWSKEQSTIRQEEAVVVFRDDP